jgi:hypothetical protein
MKIKREEIHIMTLDNGDCLTDKSTCWQQAQATVQGTGILFHEKKKRF